MLRFDDEIFRESESTTFYHASWQCCYTFSPIAQTTQNYSNVLAIKV